MPSDHGLPPLRFDPIFKEKIWGGRSLERKLNKAIPFGHNIGESWELSAVPGDDSVSSSGLYAGKTLPFIFERERERLVGMRDFPMFPLLYKFIDSNDKLSVQVHPADSEPTAGAPAVFGKTECWFVVDARPGAQIICGLKEGVGLQEVREAVLRDRLPEQCNYISIKPGDVIYVPAGTVHALLDGVLVYEVQQSSDTTFRLYDWGRTEKNGVSRPLHVHESLGALDAAFHDRHKIPPVIIADDKGVHHAVRAVSRYFALEEYRNESALTIVLKEKNSFQVVSVLDGELTYCGWHGTERILKGQTVLIPACAAPLDLNADDATHFLVSYVPDIKTDIVSPLLKKGVSQEAIAGLGGNPFRNDVIAALAAH